MLGIGADRRQGLRRSTEQDRVEELLVLEGNGCDLLGQGEYDVEVLDWQDLLLSVGDPRGAGELLALRAVAVAAGVVGDPEMTASVATLDMTAPVRRATRDDVIEHAPFGGGEPTVALGDEVGPVGAHDIGEFQPWPGHDRAATQCDGSGGSRGLVTELSSRVETWV